MRYCAHCGKEVGDEAVVCIHCGCAIYNVHPNAPISEKEDKADVALVVLCVLFPLVGLILWAIKHDESPRAAATYGKAALITVCVEIGLIILLYAVLMAFIAALI